MAKEQKRKIFHNYENSYKVYTDSKRLANLNNSFSSTNFLKKKNELVIYEKVLDQYITTQAILPFEGLDDTDISLIKVISIISTTPAFSNYDLSYFDLKVDWRKIGNIYYLYLRTGGYIIYEGSSINVPIYVTLKLVSYNDRTYRAIQNMKV